MNAHSLVVIRCLPSRPRALAALAVWALLAAQGSAAHAGAETRCHVNQVGYRPGDRKLVMVTGPSSVSSFEVWRDDGTKVLDGSLSGPIRDEAAGEDVWIGDFTELTDPGTYHVEIPGREGASYDFEIREGIYYEVWKKEMYGFVFSRCGTAVDVLDSHGYSYSHPPCHLNNGLVKDPGGNYNIDVRGGWHDGANYWRTVSTAAIKVSNLLTLPDLLPDYAFGDGELAVPLEERGDGIPDLHNEARWGLDWLLKMQAKSGADRGALHRGVGPFKGGKKFAGLSTPPHADTVPKGVAGFSSAATAVAGAAFAKAARHFQAIDPEYAGVLLSAAEDCWDWLQAHPEFVEDEYSQVENYRFRADGDAQFRLWCAAELFRTTGEARYNSYFVSHYSAWSPTVDYYASAWSLAHRRVWHMPMFTYCLTDRPGVDQSVQEVIRQDLESYADDMLSNMERYAYVFLKPNLWNQSNWPTGNSVTYAVDLIMAGIILDDPKYTEGALEQLHWILGRNPLDRVFMCGVGDNPVDHPHFRPTPVCPTGFLVRGPNSTGTAVGQYRSVFGHDPPSTLECYADAANAWALNEVDQEPASLWALAIGYFALRERNSADPADPADTTPPQPFDLRSPEDGAVSSDSTLTLEWQSSSDSGSGIDRYEVYVDGAKVADRTSTRYTTSALAEGAHSWHVLAVDRAGNSTRSTSTFSFTVSLPADPAGGGDAEMQGSCGSCGFGNGGGGSALVMLPLLYALLRPRSKRREFADPRRPAVPNEWKRRSGGVRCGAVQDVRGLDRGESTQAAADHCQGCGG